MPSVFYLGILVVYEKTRQMMKLCAPTVRQKKSEKANASFSRINISKVLFFLHLGKKNIQQILALFVYTLGFKTSKLSLAGDRFVFSFKPSSVPQQLLKSVFFFPGLDVYKRQIQVITDNSCSTLPSLPSENLSHMQHLCLPLENFIYMSIYSKVQGSRFMMQL